MQRTISLGPHGSKWPEAEIVMTVDVEPIVSTSVVGPHDSWFLRAFDRFVQPERVIVYHSDAPGRLVELAQTYEAVWPRD